MFSYKVIEVCAGYYTDGENAYLMRRSAPSPTTLAMEDMEKRGEKK